MATGAEAQEIRLRQPGQALRLPSVQPSAPQPRVPAPPAPAPHLQVAHVRSANDLPAYRVVNRSTGAVFTLYYDEASRSLAESQIAPLDRVLTEVARLAQVKAGEVNWGSVSFSAQEGHGHRGPDARWQVRTDAAGKLTPEGARMLFTTIPHEQVHAAQKSRQLRLPTWFAEGQASWIGLKVTRRVNPEFADAWRDRALAAAKAPGFRPDLANWTGPRVSGEVIRAQLPPEERAKMDRDPTYRPSGTFSFTTSQTLSDESQTLGRYGAALTLFERLEADVGLDAVNAWMAAVWSHPTTPTTAELVALARMYAKRDVGPWLEGASAVGGDLP
jgi:hypothetical protein